MHDAVLAIHVTAGAAGLLLGPLALRPLVRSDDEVPAYAAYQIAVAIVTTSAIVLAALEWVRLWWLVIIAVAVQAAALGALCVRRRRSVGWRALRVRLSWGTYVGLVTALLVVSWGSPLAWILPTVAGVPLVERAASHAGRAD